MLTQAAMLVVFVLDEFISQGNPFGINGREDT